MRTITDSWLGRAERQANERAEELERLGSTQPTLTQLLYAALEEDAEGKLVRPPPPMTYERWRESLIIAQVHSYVKDRTPEGASDDYDVRVPDEVMAGFIVHAEMRGRHIMDVNEKGKTDG